MLAAVLWVGAELLGVWLARLPLGADNLKMSGLVALTMAWRGIAVMVILLIVTAANKPVGVCAVAVYAAAYTLSLTVSLIEYFNRRGPADGAPARGVVQPLGRVQAPRLDPDPPRANRHVRQQDGRLPRPRLAGHDPARDPAHAAALEAGSGQETDGRRVGLRHHADRHCRAGSAVQGDRALVPLRRDALPLHLDAEHARLRPAAVHGRDVARHPDLGDLRGDVTAIGDARACDLHRLLHALRRLPAGTAASTSRRSCRPGCPGR